MNSIILAKFNNCKNQTVFRSENFSLKLIKRFFILNSTVRQELLTFKKTKKFVFINHLNVELMN